ncbi:hypothetical protein [Ammoniphilus sp. CFH 90114]|uniref:hypothetical protein n=1 Tax=Ammoniphilus sp. CFH 90114 TaxID=2493665 RepID=UPI00100DB729|nr:hypothetical protein [Ammoniphilus sp. CFH 90114]RXT04094.1 hypothetical protein EIZ39_21175 [Ammoniphilus sp. CFH 90114]
MMELYAQKLELDQQKLIWEEHFSAKKLMEKLSLLENGLGLEDIMVGELKKLRLGTYEFYSDIAYRSYAVCTLGSYSKNFNHKYHPNIFGKASLTSKQTLDEVNQHLFYFIMYVLSIIMKLPAWNVLTILRQSFLESYTQYLAEELEHDESEKELR